MMNGNEGMVAQMAATDDFVPAGTLSEAGAELARTRLPGWLSEFVLSRGTGAFMGGYLKVVDPAAWAPALEGCYANAADSVAVMATGLADLVVWDEAGGKGGLLLLELRKQELAALIDELFFSLLEDPGFRSHALDMDIWAPGVARLGVPAYDECLGFEPLLALGGPEAPDHLARVGLREHVALITALTGGLRD